MIHYTTTAFTASFGFCTGNASWACFRTFFLSPQAGSDVRDETVPNLVQLIATASKLHCYTVHKLYRALIPDISQVRLEHATPLISNLSLYDLPGYPDLIFLSVTAY